MRALIKSLILIGSFLLFGTTYTQQVWSLDEGWRFQFGHAANPEKDFNYGIRTIFSKSGTAVGTAIDPNFVDTSWRKLDIPHDWAVELPFVKHPAPDVDGHGYKPVGGHFPETTIGWYRKRFQVTNPMDGNRYVLQFDGIFRDAMIWVNGFFVGNIKSGYIGEQYNIRDILNPSGENVLVVRVDASQYEGWFYEGAGIYRHVWLRQTAPVYIPTGGHFYHNTVSNGVARVEVETRVKNGTSAPVTCTVQSFITGRAGEPIAKSKEEAIQVGAAGEVSKKMAFSISQPRLWELDDPYLYRVITVVKQNGKEIARETGRMGIRTFRFDANEGFFLNGRHRKIMGTNNHQDHAGVGVAVPDALQFYRVRLLKNMGCNAYRTSHHPPTPELLDACDSLGMLVMDENRLLNSSPEYLDQLQRLVYRDRNHASVFLWSIGNEEFGIQATPYGKRIAATLIEKLKQWDPTRTCTYASDLANVFPGVNEVIPIRGFNYRHLFVADYHRDHPTQPIIGTEMGSTVSTRGEYAKDTIRNYLHDHDLNAPWWASTAEAWWKPAAENKYWLGGFIWTGFDYRGEPTPFRWPNINSHFGVMDVCGFPKNNYYYYQSWWTDKDVLNISPHWNWTIKWGQPAPVIDVWVNSNADSVELVLNGKKLGMKTMPRNGHLQWDVTYAPGTLEAIGYKKRRILKAKVETTGAPAEIVLTPYKTTMIADGKDIAVLNVSIIDREGREVSNANNMIRFRIKGPGKIIGVGNGDPSSHEPDKCPEGAWQRSVFNGKCQVIVQSEKEAGMIEFEAYSPGLWSGSTDIVTVPVKNLEPVTVDPTYILKGEAAKPQSATPMLGADISFLPELEARGVKFSENGKEEDVLSIMKRHGFNYVRLRVFHNPSLDSGYSPGKGFCDLAHTKAMAKRVKEAGMKFLLDFHYSDYWADPGKQYKPYAWRGLSFSDLKKALYDYTLQVMNELKAQGTLPDMVQVGNEINHGIVWPEGNVANPDQMAQLVSAGVAAVKTVAPSTVLLLHLALGGQNEETVFFLEEMRKRNVPFDVIGLSYYPKWHGSLDDLRDNMLDLINRYDKDIIVVEYSARKEEVNKLVFELPRGKGKGTCIWEPLSTWESFFDRDGKANDYLKIYDQISSDYLR